MRSITQYYAQLYAVICAAIRSIIQTAPPLIGGCTKGVQIGHGIRHTHVAGAPH